MPAQFHVKKYKATQCNATNCKSIQFNTYYWVAILANQKCVFFVNRPQSLFDSYLKNFTARLDWLFFLWTAPKNCNQSPQQNPPRPNTSHALPSHSFCNIFENLELIPMKITFASKYSFFKNSFVQQNPAFFSFFYPPPLFYWPTPTSSPSIGAKPNPPISAQILPAVGPRIRTSDNNQPLNIKERQICHL